MAYCYKCGTKLPDDAVFCPSCGAKHPNTGTQHKKNGNIFDSVRDINNTPDYTLQMDPRDIDDNKIFAILAYLGLLVLVPIFAAPRRSRYARFHANQGLVLFVFDMAFNLVLSIINTAFNLPRILSLIINGGTVADLAVPSIVSSILSLFSLVFFVLMIIGIVNAATGKCKELPIIGKIRLLK